jgi:hypothetical protein
MIYTKRKEAPQKPKDTGTRKKGTSSESDCPLYGVGWLKPLALVGAQAPPAFHSRNDVVDGSERLE